MAKMRFSPRPTRIRDCGLEGEDLPADFRADAAAGAGDHHPPPFEQFADVFGVERDGVAAQEVVDFDVADGNLLVAVQPILKERMIFRFSSSRSQASIRLRSRWPGRVPATTSTSVASIGGSQVSPRLPAGRGWGFGPTCVGVRRTSSVASKPRTR